MKFNFKNSDMVTCEVLRTTVIAKQDVVVGTIVKVNGWIAKQLMSGALPALKLVGDGSPESIQERDSELIISTPAKANKPAAKKKAVKKEPEPENIGDEASGD